jgi:hypothetical protein
MGIGIGEREDLRIVRLSEANTRSMYTRSAKREITATRGGSSAFLRAVTASSRHR